MEHLDVFGFFLVCSMIVPKYFADWMNVTCIICQRLLQDELGDRAACERAFVAALSSGKEVVVDR